MAESAQLRPRKEAARITVMLDTVLGTDRFDRAPVDMINLALEYSRNTAPNEAIERIDEAPIPGCVGALVCGDDKPRKWGILYDEGQSPGRRAFTVGHEFGHWVLHRDRVDIEEELADGFYCDDEAITQRDGLGIEEEADIFAADLLMPFHDFRNQLPPRDRPDFDRLERLAKRYGVSLEAAIIRWLEYTETRAILVVSNEGFARWSKPSKPALKSGRFIRTKRTTYSLPLLATAVTRNFVEETKAGIEQDAGVWFSEPLIEMCFRSERYDQEYTLLHFERERVWDFERE